MKWRCRKPEAYERALRRWHQWFAWKPVRVPTRGRLSGQTMVWLQWIERKGRVRYSYGFTQCWYEWEYRWPAQSQEAAQ